MSTSIISEIRERAAAQSAQVVFPESTDPRVLRAVEYLSKEKICEAQLIGDPDKINDIAQKEGIELPKELTIYNPKSHPHQKEVTENFYHRRKHKGVSREESSETMKHPLQLGAGIVACQIADACVGGSIATTGEVIRAAIYNVGMAERTSTVSSTFLMALDEHQPLTYADCGVVPYPDAQQLAEIALQSADTHYQLTQQEPVVAMLSFSTKGSAKHKRTQLVTNALQIVHQRAPDLSVDGELQFDTAIDRQVAQRKAPESAVAGQANVFIFPNLDAGNIGYKITERLAGATATGPILQGLARPVMDLSRGCSWQDIVNAACVGILLS